MWQIFRSLDSKRRHALKSLADNPLKACLSRPFPAGRQSCKETRIIALDFETTGLDPDNDRILSIGLVAIENMVIHLDSAWHQLIRTDRAIPEASAVIHRITDDQARQGRALEEVLPELLARLAGNLLLVHHAAIETGFLQRACRELYGGDFIAPLIDTERLARRRYEKRHQAFNPRDLRLFNLRRHYRLPRYSAHNALSDALSTAELFLAMAADMDVNMNCRIKTLLSP